MDLTEVPTLFPSLPLNLMVVLDAYSRLPLAAVLRFTRPSARLAAGLFSRAVRTQGRPRHLVVDQGSQFTAREFRALVKRQGIRIRYGAVGETHSLGLIDRFFRTLKDSLSLRDARPWSLREATGRLHLALVHYAFVRPHASLKGFTPVGAHYGIRGHLPRPAPPPRGAPGDSEPEVPFDFVFLDPWEQGLPRTRPQPRLRSSSAAEIGERQECGPIVPRTLEGPPFG